MPGDRSKQPQHLTSLDLDISGVIESLRAANEAIEKGSIEAGRKWADKFNETIRETNNSITSGGNTPGSSLFDAKSIINDSDFESAMKLLQEKAREFGEYAKVTVKKVKDDLVGTVTYDDSLGNAIAQSFKFNAEDNSWEEYAIKVEDNAQKAKNAQIKAAKEAAEAQHKIEQEIAKTQEKVAKEAERAREKAAKDSIRQQEKLYSQRRYGANLIDEEIKKQEKASKSYSSALKEQMQTRIKEQQVAERTISQLDTLIKKQKVFNEEVSKQRSSATNKNIIANNDSLIASIEKLKSQIRSQGYVTKDQESIINNYKDQISELGDTYNKSGTKGESFLRAIGDKAKWLSAFYIVNELKNAFFNSIEVIKETEDAVVDLQRVLNNDTLSNSAVSEELYNIAYEFGRTFEEVSEVSTRFAQAGYEWNDVIELTRGTMLALNTAELDVTQSTQGLIAVMAQWGKEADEFSLIIDKINTTADHFPVTSETIVDALQRTSSTAKAANMSMEQTIGVITALSEATGRSGEHIGVALNALTQFTSTSKALNTFSTNGSEAMQQLVADYNKGAASIYDIWVQLAKDLENISEQQSEALLKGADFDELATELQSALQDAYGTAGTYRRSDFIAMLKDIGTADDVLRNMGDAAGYSQKENEKYMETLTASFNQLKIALQELAVQAGEGPFGLLNILKGLTDSATGIAKLVKNLGGVIPLLTAISGILLRIKSVKVVNLLSSLSKSVISGIDTVRLFGLEIADLAKKEGVASAATWGFKTAIGGLTGAIGIGISSFVLIKGAIDNYNREQEEARLNTIQKNEDIIKESDSLINLVKEYENVSESQLNLNEKENQFLEIGEKINTAIGDRQNKLSGLKVGTEEYTKALKELNEEERKRRNAALQETLSSAGEQVDYKFKNILGKGTADFRIFESTFEELPEELSKKLKESLASFRQLEPTLNEYVYKPLGKSKEEFADFSLALISAKDNMDIFSGSSKETYEAISNSVPYDIIKSFVELLEDSESGFESYTDTLIKLSDALNDMDPPKSLDDVNDRVNKIADDLGFKSDAAKEHIRSIIIELYNLKDSAQEAGNGINEAFNFEEAMVEIGDAIAKLNESVDGFQSGLGTMRGAIDEFNKTGKLSIDTIQGLIGVNGEYLQALNISSEGITWNKEKLDELINSQKQNVLESIDQAEAVGILQIVNSHLAKSTESVSNAEDAASKSSSTLTGKIQTLNKQMDAGVLSAMSYASALVKIADPKATLNGIDFKNMVEDINSYRDSMQGLRDELLSSGSDFENWSSTASSSASKAAEDVKYEIDVIKDSIQELSSAIDEAQSGINVAYDAMAEFNEQGYLSVDTIQAIVNAGGEYLSLLDFTSQGISINKENLDRLLTSQQNNINAMIQQGYAADVCRIAEQYLGVQLSQASVEAANANVSLASMNPTLAALTDNAWASANAANGLASALANLYGKSLSAGNMAAFQRDLDASRQRWKSLLNEAQRSAKNVDAVSSSAAKYHENERKKAADAEKKALEQQKKALEAQKKAVKERYDAEIAALKKVEKENDRIRRKEEYYRNRQEILNDIERAATRSGIEYRQQESEAKQKLEDLDRKWRETLEDWSIEDKISELEALRDAEIAALDAQIDAISDKMSSISSEAVSSASGANQQIASNFNDECLSPISDSTLDTSTQLNGDLLNNYDSQFLQPVTDMSANAYGNINNTMKNDFSSANAEMLTEGRSVASALYAAYEGRFFTPMRQSIEELKEQFYALKAIAQSIPNSMRGNGNANPTSIENISRTINNNNNSTNNSNIFANVNLQRQVNKLFDLTHKP